ncbi:GNAT family N-acetyltransferase [Pseudoalteromonas sp. T1lg88]|uniref:GNAT family N-acetyltransferase n=1 Tax=Pseudoalteromonas sp. T1lg88 TaxID=2077104 RepID=UPI000CF63364|nr:GNAT family N-acetyltransferase [Pseudoalteromonas sp. T1lg88]
MKGYRISTNHEDLDFEVIYQFISQSYWAMGIPRATFAYLADVFVVEAHRGKGLSKWLVESIVSHPDLQGLRRMVLATRDAHGLYAQYGFKGIENPEILMQIWQPDIYSEQKA